MSAIVTGASGSLGRAIAVALAKEGRSVGVHYRSNAAGAQETCRIIESWGQQGSVHQLDLAIDDPSERDAAAAALLDGVAAVHGSIDVLVINAGVQDVVAWNDADAAHWDAVLDANLGAAASLIHAAGQRMSDGVIVTIGSVEGYRPARAHTAYAVAKAGLHHLTAAAAIELADRGVRVVGVAPGLIDRPGLAHDWPDGVARWSAASAIGRPVTASEVANVVSFLASQAATAVNGIVVPVDGGWSASPGW